MAHESRAAKAPVRQSGGVRNAVKTVSTQKLGQARGEAGVVEANLYGDADTNAQLKARGDEQAKNNHDTGQVALLTEAHNNDPTAAKEDPNKIAKMAEGQSDSSRRLYSAIGASRNAPGAQHGFAFAPSGFGGGADLGRSAAQQSVTQIIVKESQKLAAYIAQMAGVIGAGLGEVAGALVSMAESNNDGGGGGGQ